jgi:hypothetical protein
VRAILRALSRLRHSPKLGGQHGEEAKDEDEVSDEKRRKEDPEEEVSTRCFSVVDFDEVDDCVTRAGESRGAVRAFATALRDRRSPTIEDLGETGVRGSPVSASRRKMKEAAVRAIGT